uniref:Uncharacterized protein n=1 Tax=Arundo donax TaxID=35708 RepID=A0A0A8XRN9_ARUDO
MTMSSSSLSSGTGAWEAEAIAGEELGEAAARQWWTGGGGRCGE